MADLNDGYTDTTVSLSDLSSSTPSPVSFDNFSTSNEEIARAERLEQAKKDKLDRLSNLNQNASLDNSYTDLGNGILESNRNKVWNDLNDQEFQSVLDYGLSNYALTPDEQGNLVYGNGEAYSGPTRRLYMFGTEGANPEVKFGLAKGDLEGSEARYIPDGNLGGYGWKPGEYGVNTEDKQLDVLLPDNVATMLEGLGHGRTSALGNRVVKDRYGDVEGADNYGSGASEYYSSREGLLGAPTEIDKAVGQELFSQYLADVQRVRPNKGIVDEEANLQRIIRQNQEREADQGGFFNRAGNTLAGFGASFVDSLIVAPTDAVGDLTGLFDIGSDEENTASVNEFFGYNPVQAERAMQNIGQQWDIVADENATTAERMKAAGNGALEAFITPEMWGTSMGMLASWVTPGALLKLIGVGSKFANTAKAIDAAAEAGDITKAAARLQKAKAFMSVDGAKAALTAQSGFMVSAMGNVNKQYNEFVENNNGVELEGAEKAQWFAGRFAVQMVNQNLDKLVDFSIIKSPGMIASAIPAVKAMTNKEFAKVAKTMAKGVAVTGTNIGKEAAQEYSQTMMELFNSRYGSEKFSNVDEFTAFITDKRNTTEAGIAALAGAGGAPQFEAMGSVLPAVGEVVKGVSKIGGAVGERIQSTRTPEPTPEPVVDPEVSTEDLAAATTEADTTASRTASKYARMFGQDELLMMDAAETLEDQEAVPTPSLQNALDQEDMSFSDIISEIESAEAVIDGRTGTERATEGDTLALNVLRRAKLEASKKAMEAENGPTLGSGFSPEDVVDTFIEAKVSVEGNLDDFTEEEKTLVNTYLSKNGAKPFRFKNIQARLDGKDAEMVQTDAQGAGKNSAPNRRARLVRLINTPGVNKKAVEKELSGIKNFLQTQLDRKESIRTTVNEVQADIDNYNKNRNKSTVKVVKPKGKDVPGTKNFINVQENADGSFKIQDNSQALIDSIDDNIDHLQTTLSRYRKATVKILGEQSDATNTIEVPVETMGNEGIKKSRAKHKKLYDDRKPTRVITDEKDSPKWWKKDGDYTLLNESKVANQSTDFTEDDVVLLTTLNFKKGSTASKALRKAIDAGATIIVDEPIDNSKTQKRIALLAKSYGGGFVTQDGKKAILPRAKAAEVTKKNQVKAKTKRREEGVKARLVKAFDAVQSAKAEKRTVTKEEREALAKAKESAKEYFKGDNAAKNMRDYVARVLGEEGDKLATDLEAIALSDGLDSKAYTERLGEASRTAGRIAEKKVRQKIERLIKGGTLVKEWKDAETDAKKGGKPLSQWIKETFGDSAKAIAKKLLSDSIGKANEGTRKIYVYKPKGKNDYVPTSNLNDAKQFSEDGTYQVIEINPEKYVQVGEATVLNTLNVEELKLEGEANALFNDFVESALEGLQKTVRKVNLKRSILPLDLVDSPAASLIFDAEGNINPNVAVAVRVALYNFINNNAYLMSKDMKSEQDIAQILGKHESELSDAAIIAMQDKGLLFKTSADSVGKDIVKLLGLKGKSSEEVDVQLFNALTTELGQIALAVGMQKDENLLEIDSMDSVKFAVDVLGKNKEAITESDAKVNFVKVKDKEAVEDASFVVEVLNNTLPNMDVRRKEPLFTTPSQKQKDKAAAKIRKERLGVNVAGKSKEAMEKLMDTEMVADMPLVRFVIENKERIKKLLGYVPLEDKDGNPHPDFLKLSYKEQQVQASRNRDIEQEIAHLEWLNSETDEGTNKVSMWFNYFFSKNGRFFVDSNTINPQNNKHLHRFTVQPKEHNNTYRREGNVFKVGGNDVTNLVHYALAQGFGFATDKKSEKEITEFATAALKKLNSVEALNKAREDFLNEGKYDLGNGLEIEIEHLGHALQAFQFVEDSLKTPGKFDSAITAEFDAVTSGFALKLLQMPIVGKKLYTWLGKVGVFRHSDAILNRVDSITMNNVLSLKEDKEQGLEKFLDSYQFLASSIKGITYKDVQKNSGGSALLKADKGYSKDLWEAVAKVLPSVDPEGGISSDLRNLFKYPFMTFNYASSIKSIRGRLKGTMKDDITKSIAKLDLDKEQKKEKDQSLVEMLKVFAETDDVKELKRLQNLIRTKDINFVRMTNKGASLGAYLDVMIDSSYGIQVEQVLNAEFQPFVEAQDAINNSFKAMFEVFKVSFEEKLAEARKEGPVSYEKEKEIYESLINQWPAIKGPLSNMAEDFTADGAIGVYSMDTASPYGVYAGRKAAITYLTPEAAKSMKAGVRESIRTSHMIKALSAAISAGSVVPIHYIDGAVMATAINEMNGGMTSIHDAIMPNLLRMGEVQTSYNRATLEVSAGYSFINEIVKSLDRAIQNTELFSEEGPTAYQKAKVVVDRETTSNAASYLIEARNVMANLANTVNAERKKLFDELNKGASVMHMAGSSDGVFTVDENTQIEYKEIDMYEEIKDNSTNKSVDDITIEELDNLATKHC